MTTFIDKYKRTWNHTPDHDTDLMLQIKPEVMLLVYNFRLSMHRIGIRESWPVPNPDCYLLKGAGNWHVGIRLSDEPSDYISPYFEDELITFLIKEHGRHVSKGELEAYSKLVEGDIIF